MDIYKKTTSIIFQKFYNEMNDISKAINAIENLNIEERIIKPLIFEAEANQAKEYETLEVKLILNRFRQPSLFKCELKS